MMDTLPHAGALSKVYQTATGFATVLQVCMGICSLEGPVRDHQLK